MPLGKGLFLTVPLMLRHRASPGALFHVTVALLCLGCQWFCYWGWQDCLSGIRNDSNLLMSFSKPLGSSRGFAQYRPGCCTQHVSCLECPRLLSPTPNVVLHTPHEPPLSPEPRPRSSPASETWNALRLFNGRARKSLSYNLATLLSVRNCIWLKAGELLAHPLPASRDANTTGVLSWKGPPQVDGPGR